MKNYILILLIPLSCLFTGCLFKQDVRIMNRMEGDWTITKSERWSIKADGSEKFEDIENAGTVLIEEDPQSISGATKILNINYVNVNGNPLNASVFLVIDDQRKRVSWKNVLCNDIFECDLMFEIEERSSNRLVWTTYFIGEASKIYDPAFMYQPYKSSFNTKWTLTLEK